jgi:hypothetical protein
VEDRVATGTDKADDLTQAVLDKAMRGELIPLEAELSREESRSYEPGWVLLGRVQADRGRRKLRTGRSFEQVSFSGQADARRSGQRSRPLAVYDPDQILIAFRQTCWGAGALTQDELIRQVADRLGIGRIGRNIRARLLELLDVAIARRIVARRGEVLEGATPTFARYDDEFLFQVLRSLLRTGTEYELGAVARSVASHLGYGQVTGALRNRIEDLVRTGVRRGILGVREGKIWRRG